MNGSIRVLIGFVLLGGAAGFAAQRPPDQDVDYIRQIKPILARRCVGCHGPKKQKGGLRLDAARLARLGGDRGPAIVAGKSEESVLYQALLGEGDVKPMPYDRPKLPEPEIALIKKWIDQGARVPAEETVAETDRIRSDHWAFQPIRRPAVPEVSDPRWPRNEIDAFILARLDREGLSPSPEADRGVLIRRVHLDLLGLLPSKEKVDAFLADARPGAYERLVDRLLASPRYGERWGRHWLDLARYADSDGFTIDAPRSIWKYRDWVIGALNRDLAFDEFSTEQLAGDLLPAASLDQIIATGFHRNTLINQEGGTDDEQFRVEAVVDRVNTTGSVFLGLTIGCAQCHEHKFDPISQRDFYRLFAFFNNCEDNNDANGSGPILSLPSREQAAERKRLDAEIAAAGKPLREHDAKLAKAQPAWEKRQLERKVGAWRALDPVEWKTARGTVLRKLEDKSLLLEATSAPSNDTYTVVVDVPIAEIAAVRIEALTHPSLPDQGPGRGNKGNFVLSEVELFAAPRASAGAAPVRVPLSRAVADHSQELYRVSNALDGNPKTGWAINVKKGSPNVNREAIFFPDRSIRNEGGSRLTLKLHQNHDQAKYLLGCFRISVSRDGADSLEVPSSIRKILAVPSAKRTDAQAAQAAAFFRGDDVARKALADTVSALKKRREQLRKAIPATMVLKERKDRRKTHLMLRGDFLRKGAVVQPGVPRVFPQLPAEVKHATRLDFARWLFDPRNPLTSRVTVNRFWQRFFGIGIVETENDFGTQGIRPEHPELLDWLADEFIRREWGIKSLHRLIVTSATYRQSSRMRPELLKRDPRNKLVARQSRIRLEAESIRDACLSASGLLSDKIGGPGVYPPQPEGIYVTTQHKKRWPENRGDDRYRRGMYTYFWRSAPYPFLMTFDAPTATTTCTCRPRSNTPLQALTLANGRAFVEFARSLAGRILRNAPGSDESRIRYAFAVCLARPPGAAEVGGLREFLERQRAHFASAAKEAEAVAPAGRPTGVGLAEAAAWTAVARVLLNLDEFITRE